MRIFPAVILLLVFTKTVAQVTCGTERQHNYLMQHAPEYARLVSLQKYAPLPGQLKPETPGHPDTIPIVVHVVHTGGAIGSEENPADSTIQKMIDKLNLYFSAAYPDEAGLNKSIGVDIGLYFTLASASPSCLQTNGINRINAGSNVMYKSHGVSVEGLEGISQEMLAGFGYWNNTRYLNVWLVNKVANNVYTAYAYFPTGQLTIYDGVIMEKSSVNRPAILAHEIGHAFSLYHTFAGSEGASCSINRNCAIDGDGVCDTDPVLQSTGGCIASSINPCTNHPFGNMVYNHMSYSCGTVFSSGQKSRMRAALDAYRSSWLHPGASNIASCVFQPVQFLSSFTEKKSCNMIQLRWKTTAEQECRVYEIEASEDGLMYAQVGALRALGGYNDTVEYNFSYAAIRNGRFILRIKQVSWDGSSTYYNLREAQVNCVNKPFTVYPNPATEFITVATGSSTKNSIAIYAASGQLMGSWNNTEQKRFDVRDFPPAVYILSVNNAVHLRFIKQ